MYISNYKLIQSLLSSGINSNDLIGYLQISSNLIKKYGRNLFLKDIDSSIQDTDKILHMILHILFKYNKYKYTIIKTLIKIIKNESTDYTLGFVIETKNIEKIDSIEKNIHSQFESCNIEKKTSKNTGLFVHGEGWYYKRTIDNDLTKLLG